MERLRRIEAGEPPFDNPPIAEDGEPPYLTEWCNTQTALDVVGQSCVGLLSDTVKLFFAHWSSRVVPFSLDASEMKLMKERGFLAGYRKALGEIYDTDWSDCPVRFDIIEQVVLARNRTQHGGSLMTLRVTHDRHTLNRHPRPHFASADEIENWAGGAEADGGSWGGFGAPAVTVSREALFTAIEEVERLAQWLDQEISRAWDWMAAGKEVRDESAKNMGADPERF